MRKSITLENVPLIDDTLRGVYPFDPALTEAMQKRVAKEAVTNPQYGMIITDMAEKLQKKVLDEHFAKQAKSKE